METDGAWPVTKGAAHHFGIFVYIFEVSPTTSGSLRDVRAGGGERSLGFCESLGEMRHEKSLG